MSPHPLLVHGALILVSSMFGVNYVTMRWILAAGVSPESWALYRLVGASAVLVPVALLWSRRRGASASRVSLRIWATLALAALLGVALNQVLFAEGLHRTTPAQCAVICTCIPVLTTGFAVLVGQERFRRRSGLALVVALSGALLLLRADRWLDQGLALERTWVGNLITLAGAVSFSLFLVLMRSLRRTVDPLFATAVSFLFGTLMVGAWSASSVDATSWSTVVAPDIWPWALFTILFVTVLGYFLNNWALRHTTSSHVALYIYLQPVIATGLSMAADGDRPQPRFWIAAALICLGLFLHDACGQAGRRA